MQEHTAAYVATDELPQLPPPASDDGFAGTLRKNLFSTPVDTVLTAICGAFIIWSVWNILNWAIFDAVFTGTNREACLVEGGGHGGACWAFVKAKLAQFTYGVYPIAERWRIDVCFALLAILVAGLMIPKVPYKRINAVLLFAVYPVVALVLLTGGEFDLAGGVIALAFLAAAAATMSGVASVPRISAAGLELRIAPWAMLAAFALLMLATVASITSFDLLGYDFSLPSLMATLSALAAIGLIVTVGLRSGLVGWRTVALPGVVALLFIIVMSGDFGLRSVPTNLWGGLMLTLVVALSGIGVSLPFGVVLALGRRSHMPAVRLVSVIFIEFWRGVPLITVLFMANFMLPLFMPEGVSFDQLLRAVVGVALFASAYMAEVIRGGLQAIPKGQYEGAEAMALSYWQKMRLIILPQALKLVIPGIVNTFIGLFKDTSLVYIIGLADLLGTVKRGFSDPNWITPSTPATGLIFAAFVFWLFCFGMSRYSIFVERRLDTGHK